MLLRHFHHLRRALWQAFRHNLLGNAKAAAYSSILGFFPALLVLTTLLAVSPNTNFMRGDLRSDISGILPPDTMSLVQAYFLSNHLRSFRIILTSVFIVIASATGVMLALMEGFRLAYRLPRDSWNFWRERVVAVALVPGTIIPMIFATVLVAFGHSIEHWMFSLTGHAFRFYVVLFWRLARWLIASATSIGVLSLIYHFGLPHRQRWRQALPGATLATITWFVTTLIYGWYVTRHADYSVVYGPLAAAVATLVWLYMVCVSILMGAEYNAQVHPLLPRVEGAPAQSERR